VELGDILVCWIELSGLSFLTALLLYIQPIVHSLFHRVARSLHRCVLSAAAACATAELATCWMLDAAAVVSEQSAIENNLCVHPCVFHFVSLSVAISFPFLSVVCLGMVVGEQKRRG
jgi:hypothetical protein